MRLQIKIDIIISLLIIVTTTIIVFGGYLVYDSFERNEVCDVKYGSWGFDVWCSYWSGDGIRDHHYYNSKQECEEGFKSWNSGLRCTAYPSYLGEKKNE